MTKTYSFSTTRTRITLTVKLGQLKLEGQQLLDDETNVSIVCERVTRKLSKLRNMTNEESETHHNNKQLPETHVPERPTSDVQCDTACAKDTRTPANFQDILVKKDCLKRSSEVSMELNEGLISKSSVDSDESHHQPKRRRYSRRNSSTAAMIMANLHSTCT